MGRCVFPSWPDYSSAEPVNRLFTPPGPHSALPSFIPPASVDSEVTWCSGAQPSCGPASPALGFAFEAVSWACMCCVCDHQGMAMNSRRSSLVHPAWDAQGRFIKRTHEEVLMLLGLGKLPSCWAFERVQEKGAWFVASRMVGGGGGVAEPDRFWKTSVKMRCTALLSVTAMEPWNKLYVYKRSRGFDLWFKIKAMEQSNRLFLMLKTETKTKSLYKKSVSRRGKQASGAGGFQFHKLSFLWNFRNNDVFW